MAKTHTITIRHDDIVHGIYDPNPFELEVGDSVIWFNDTDMTHTATSFDFPTVFDTEDIAPHTPSAPELITTPSDLSGFLYGCIHHGAMEGTLVVKPSPVYSPDEWGQISQIVAANWAYDMADDFQTGIANLTGADQQRVIESWNELNSWWQSQVGAHPIADQVTLSGQPLALLRQLCDKLRHEYYRLVGANGRPLLQRAPNPNHPGDGQSALDFGKAITVLGASPETSAAYFRELTYMRAAARIVRQAALGNDVSALMPAYEAAKANVTADDYLLLAKHQSERLRTLFGQQAFDAAQFTTGIWQMTLTGEWDEPSFSLWHWLGWIDVYLASLADGTIIDVLEPALVA